MGASVEVLEDAIVSAATGLVRRPIAGLRRSGWRGAVKGGCTSVVGALAKPIGALFFFGAKATEGLATSARRRTPTMRLRQDTPRIRQPREISDGGVLLKYPPPPLIDEVHQRSLFAPERDGALLPAEAQPEAGESDDEEQRRQQAEEQEAAAFEEDAGISDWINSASRKLRSISSGLNGIG